jgi:hypothetical protein
MSVFKVNLNIKNVFDLAKFRTSFVDEKLISDVQKQVVDDEIKRAMLRGLSPVRGFGRFGEYLNPAKYPGKGKKRKKASRPVNLFLTGQMQSYLKALKGSATQVLVGITPSAPKIVKVKAEANNLGTVTKAGVGAIPRRRFIPQKGEIWNVTIIRKVKDLVAKRAQALFNKGK